MSAFSEAAEADKQAYLVSAQVPVARSEQEVAEYLANFRIGSPVSVDRACIDAEVGVIDGLAARRCAEAVLDLIAREAAT
jgi:hypothetical protein